MWRLRARFGATALVSGARSSARSRAASSLASLVHAHALATPSALALAAPQQGVAWSYAELSQRAGRVAAALARLGLGRGGAVVTDLPNSAENLLLQVAASHLGAAVATAKDTVALADLGRTVAVQCAVAQASTVEGASSWLAGASLPRTPVVVETLDGSLSPLTGAPGEPPPVAAADDALALGYWSSTKPLTNGEALSEMGMAAKDHLAVTPKDRVLVSITLCHAFGIGSAVGSALSAGAAVVLPGASGIRGCGSPGQRAQVTLEVLESQCCTLLFADVHTLKALPAPGQADLGALRGGACKVGSGADFLDDIREAKLGPNGEMRPLEFAGVPLVAVGKR
mmetsp:Transcript_74992/g.223485  ORF Transcript_74992/g.223485 Transcript_74992/m.223485 type:complete len:341 (-) Transcript_74992:66-1088(-)